MTTNITVNALADMLNSLKGSTAISLISVTPPKMKAKCPRTNILKESYKSGLLGCSYENRVNNQLGRENKELDFKAKKMSFGQLSENKVVKTKTNKDGTTKRYIYLHVKDESTIGYTSEGQEVSEESIALWLPKESKPNTQAKSGEHVKVKQITLENIKSIKMLKEEYNIVEDSVEGSRIRNVTERDRDREVVNT